METTLLDSGVGEPVADVECADELQEQGAAVAVAQACDDEVEVLDGRTEWQTLYAQPDGSMRLEMSAAAVRTRNGARWQGVDNTLRRKGRGIVVTAPVVPMTFSDGRPGMPLATLQRDGHELSFGTPFDLPTPTVQDHRLTYEDVVPGVDLVVTVNDDATGFSEVLRVESPEAAADPRLAQLTFPVETSSDLDVEPDAGGFVARDEAGEIVFHGPTPAMWDSSVVTPSPTFAGLSTRRAATLGGPLAPGVAGWGGGAAAGEPIGDRNVAPVAGAVVSDLPASVTEDAVTIEPNKAMLADPDTVWPVYIDPPVSGSLHLWSAVRTGVSPAIRYMFTDSQGVGLCDPRAAGGGDCPSRYASRLLWRFAGLENVGAVDGGHIQSAVFSVFGTHTYDCAERPVTAYLIADFDGNTGWPGSPSWTPLDTRVVNHKPACGTPQTFVEFNVTAAARAVADANASVLALGLAADESSMAFWKRYRYDARLSVTYNRPPVAPTGAVTSSPATTCVMGANRPLLASQTPTLRATIADPDGDAVEAVFDVLDVATGTRVWGPAVTGRQASGAQHAVTVTSGIVDGRAYQWRVYGRDPSGAGSIHIGCEFVVDVTPPVMPTVTPVPVVMPAVYLEDQTSGGIGQRGAFDLSIGTSTDVVAVQYAFNRDAGYVSTTPPASGVLQIPFRPTTDGVHTLYVKSVDRAGNVSPTRVYRFVVQAPGVVALWHLDEPAAGGFWNTRHTDSGPEGDRFPLTSSPYTGRGDGLFRQLGLDDNDRALRFNGVSGSANTSGPVIGLESSFTVMAFLRLTSDPGGGRTAVSVDGGGLSSLVMGTVSGSTDSESACYKSQWCWGAELRTVQGSVDVTRLYAARPTEIRVGDWVHLAVIHNAETQTLTTSVCRIGNPDTGDIVANPVSRGSGRVIGPIQHRGGALRLGHAMTTNPATLATSAVNPWPGLVDEVRVIDAAASAEDLRRYCVRGD